MTPEQIAKSGTEAANQAALFAWAAIESCNYPELKLLFAIPNGGARNPATAGVLKATGVKAGVPDMFLPVVRGEWYGLFIELKKGGGKPSPEQLKWGCALREQGYGFVVCVGWEKARDVILQYLDWGSNENANLQTAVPTGTRVRR